jgi:hypothetical protein
VASLIRGRKGAFMAKEYSFEHFEAKLNELLDRYELKVNSFLLDETGKTLKDFDDEKYLNIKVCDFTSELIVNDEIEASLLAGCLIKAARNHTNLASIIMYLDLIGEIFIYIKSSEFVFQNSTLSEFMSKNGSKGATIKHEPMRKLKAFTLKLAMAYPFNKSANSIAFEIKNTVFDYGKTINAILSQHSAQDTIKKWINESRNKNRVASR